MAISLSIYSPDLSENIYNGVFAVVEEWTPQVDEGDGTTVQEQIPLIATGTTTTIKASVLKINQLLRRAALYISDETKREYVTLRMTSDTDVLQQSLIYRGKLVKGFAPGTTFSEIDKGVPYTLVIERHPYWESVTPVDPITPGTDLGSYGGTYVFTSFAGEVPARLERVMMSVGGGSYDFTDLWLGIKSAPVDDEGDMSDFNPVVPVGTPSTIVASKDTSAVVDATRSSAYIGRCSFGTIPGNDIRMITSINYGVATPGIWQGRYLMLMAARVSSIVAGLQVRIGFAGMSYSDYVPFDQIEVTATTWDVHSLGYLQIPPFFPTFDDDPSWPSINLRFGIWAEKLSGTGWIDIDDIILMPVEHSAIVNGADGSPLHILSRKDDRIWTYGGFWQNPDTPGVLSVNNWGIPPRESVLVVVADEVGHNENLGTPEDVNVDLFRAYPRWRNYAQ